MVQVLTFTTDEFAAIIEKAVGDGVTKAICTPRIPSANSIPTAYLTRREVAEILGCTLPTIHAWVTQGRLRGYRIGRRILFKRQEIDEALKLIQI